MPKHSLHRKVEKAILGRAYPRVHRMLDLPGLVGMKRHRRYLHDPVSACLVGYALHGEEGAISGLLHIMLDNLCNDKKVKRLFELAFR